MNTVTKSFIIAILCLYHSILNAEILMQWKRIPLHIDLNVNQERIIFVDKNVQVGLQPELDGKIQVQSLGGAVYLNAQEPFDLSRIQLRDMETGQIILLDVKATSNKTLLEPIRIVNEDIQSNINGTIAQTEVADNPIIEKELKPALPVPAALTRYVAQSLYAPLRTIEPLDGVKRVAVKLPKSIPNLLPNFKIAATPLDSWGLGDFVVTAVKLKNLDNRRIELDPRYLQGYFYAATFQHSWLDIKGTPEDTTVVYLVTEGRPEQAFILHTPTKLKK